MVTLLVYDIATYEPVNDLTVTVYLAPPDAPRPCCQPEQHTGPIALTVDPEIYPGDYSNLIALDQPGAWEVQFNATAPATAAEKSFSLVVPLTVNASMGGSAPIPLAAATPDVAATATSFAQNVATARQGVSPLPAPVSPIAAPDAAEPVAIVRTAWWLWGGVGLIPIVLIGWLILRSPSRQADGPEAEEQGQEEADD
jgi:ABC-type transport system substrate-binding protein